MSEFVTIPKCKDSYGYEWCGKTCNCGYSDYKRHLVIQTLRQQIIAVRNRWGSEAVLDALAVDE